VVELSDKRRDPAWQAAHQREFQALIDEMLAIRTVGADEPGKVIGARRQIEARPGHATYSRLPQLTMPVLICGGRYNGVAPVENQEALLRQISSARMVLFEGGICSLCRTPERLRRLSPSSKREILFLD
jgi:3-oxoadipate enol-lactonase